MYLYIHRKTYLEKSTKGVYEWKLSEYYAHLPSKKEIKHDCEDNANNDRGNDREVEREIPSSYEDISWKLWQPFQVGDHIDSSSRKKQHRPRH